ncbi:MAG: hypothetical protein ACPLW8_07180, partial [Candidatus Bathyarchaeales archaeon]
NGQDWEFYDAIIGGLMMTPLEPSEIKQFAWKLSYPAGHYRVGTKGVYAEFDIVEVKPSEAELRQILDVYEHKLGGQVVVIN